MKKIIILVIIILAAVNLASAQSYIRLWDKPLDDYRKSAVRLYSYPAPDSINNHAAIIFCPGGSYCYLAKKNEGHDPAKLFRDKYGFNTFVLIYRRGMRGNRYPSQIQDLQKAMRYVADNSPKFGIDTTQIGICGFSAGGHLVGTEAEYFDVDFVRDDTRPAPPKPMFAIMMYPVVSMDSDIGHKKSRRNLLGADFTQERRDSMSLEKNVRRDMPPIFLVACKDDPIVDYRNSERMSDALDSKNVSCSYSLYETGGHGFGINPSLIKSPNKDAADWHKDFMFWLKKCFILK